MGWLIGCAYLYAILPSVNDAFTAALAMAGTLAGASVLWALIVAGPITECRIFDLESWPKYKSERDMFDTMIRWAKRAGLVWLALLIVGAVIPDREGFKYIVGAVIVTEAAEGISKIEGIDKLPANVVEALNVMMEDLTGTVVEETAGEVTEAVTGEVATQ